MLRRPHAVEFTRAARKDLDDIPRPMRLRILEAIEALADEPRPNGCRKLVGGTNEYRIRIGDYRVLYEVEDEAVLVLVVRVAHRREAYR